jgi:hypothetical protein
MIYFLLIVMLNDSAIIESYSSRADCEVRRQVIKIDYPGASTACLRMESKGVV